MKTARSFTRPRRLPRILALGLLILSSQALLAQQPKGEVSPDLQQLFNQARQAHQQGDNATAIQRYQEIIQRAPNLAAAYNNLGMLYFDTHDYSHAVDALNHCLQLAPSMTNASALLGMSYFQLRLSQKAEPYLRTALKANPADDNIEMILALALFDLHQYPEAASHLNNLCTRNPKNLEALYWLRKTYLQMADDTQAKVDAVDPDSVVAHEINGEVEERLRNYAGALSEYQKAAEKAPHQPGTHMNVANAYWRLGNWRSAQAEYRSELDNDPNNCLAHWKLADSMLEANDSAQTALAELDRSIAQCPALMQARLDRARAFIRLDQQTDALPDLLAVEKDSPQEPTVHFLLSTVYKSQGNVADAQREMHTFEELKAATVPAQPQK